MKTISWIILISMFNFVNCTSTYLIKHEKDYNELNRKLEGKQVLIILKNNEVVTAEGVMISIDSTSWFISQGVKHHRFEPNDRQLIPTSEVRRVKLKSSINGAFFGFFSGVIIGLASYYTFYSLGIDFGLSMHPSEAMVIMGGIGAVLGAVGGGYVNYVITAPADTISKDIKRKQSSKKIESKTDSSIRVEISEVVNQDSGYIVVLWQGKKIYLSNTEYEHRVLTADGRQYIVVPKYIYESKFK